ncbi:hypothetical protein FN846DRAFT_745130 [Sphaerosporella brunnea]|uniref:C2H2-type domain-containing protein n=1 Tax=Sphaerosporella brunnea TaxID=1250544 RepID=A0A5J5EWR5_9PEZI|nr:hypothetical protein FN846DRAFT_745130 [Sphaerosporella brunnea]
MNSWPYTDASAAPETYFTATATDYPVHQAHGQEQLLSPDYSPYASYTASPSSQHSGYSRERAASSPYPSSRPSQSRSPSYQSTHRNSVSPYPTSTSHSPSFGYAPSPYTTSPHGSPSPLSFPALVDLEIDSVDPDIINCFFPSGAEVANTQTGSTSADAPAPSFPCDYPSCNKSYPRLCDLRKHKKRHEKPFSCSEPSCDAVFSTEKDRDRHERSKHRREEHLVCPVCGHRTARKDNLKDHVRRRHGEEQMAKVMRELSAGVSAG